MILEILSDSVESALSAIKGGADRIELCENILEGGVTPSLGFMEVTRDRIDKDIFAMIRPRGGDFLYTNEEFEIMKRNIDLAKSVGIQGVVLGLLDEKGRVDIKRTSELVDRAYPMQVTFHRAFDASENPIRALEDVIQTGAHRILTSGTASNVSEGINVISDLTHQAAGRIIIMPGGGIDESNIESIIRNTGCDEFHFSAKKILESKMEFIRPTLSIGIRKDFSEYQRYAVDELRVKAVKNIMLKVII